jgi:pimeloyl-ACP methyl ester carboxylesterase
MQRHILQRFEYQYRYNGQSIPYLVWASPSSDHIETIIFLGTVQTGNLPKWVAESCPPNTYVVQGAPHWYAKSDGSDIPEYMFGFTKSTFDTLRAANTISAVHIIADSQACPGVIELFSQKEYMPYLRTMALIQPLGLNQLVYAGTDKERLGKFQKRIVANVLHQLVALALDKRLRYNHQLTRKTVGLRSAKAHAQYSSGLCYDAVPNLTLLHQAHQHITIICGSHDKIFPPDEITQTLARNNLDIPVRVIPGVPHSPLATKFGQRLLRTALSYTINASSPKIRASASH